MTIYPDLEPYLQNPAGGSVHLRKHYLVHRARGAAGALALTCLTAACAAPEAYSPPLDKVSAGSSNHERSVGSSLAAPAATAETQGFGSSSPAAADRYVSSGLTPLST